MKFVSCWSIALLASVLATSGGKAQAGSATSEPSETVLDRKVHLAKEPVREIPDVPPLCGSLAGLKRRSVSLPDVKLYCEEEGGGTTIVLLHGGPGATHHEFHPAFSRAARFARVVYYDQRGCGQSGYDKGTGYSVEQASDDLHQLRQSLGIDRWVVLGHSYGGQLAQCYLAKYPEEVLGLVLVGSGLVGPPEGRTRQYDFLSKEELLRIRMIHELPGLTEMQRLYNAHLNGDWKRQHFFRPSPEALARMARYEWKHDAGFRSPMCSSVRRYDLRGAFDACPIPSLIVEGRWDLTWNAEKPDAMRAMFPHARLVVFERSGHLPFADEPDRFFPVLEEWIRGLPKVTAAEVAQWRKELAAWWQRQANDPHALLRTTGYGRASNEKIAARYRPEWLNALDRGELMKVGFALYDLARYEEALAVFRRMSDGANSDEPMRVVARVWQGQMLDLLGRREEAIAVYRQVAELKAGGQMRHDQFGLSYSPAEYAAARVKTPFVRVENRQRD